MRFVSFLAVREFLAARRERALRAFDIAYLRSKEHSQTCSDCKEARLASDLLAECSEGRRLREKKDEAFGAHEEARRSLGAIGGIRKPHRVKANG